MTLRMDERPIRLVIFDLAGTTVYDGDAVGDTLRSTLMESAGVQVSRDAANAVMGRPKDRAIAELLTKAGRRSMEGDEHVLSLLGEFEQRMLAHYRASAVVRELDGASTVFEWLQGHGVRVGGGRVLCWSWPGIWRRRSICPGA
jgi:phosphoglycolate phosphatase-like HAD superfamily hydrolase